MGGKEREGKGEKKNKGCNREDTKEEGSSRDTTPKGHVYSPSFCFLLPTDFCPYR